MTSWPVEGARKKGGEDGLMAGLGGRVEGGLLGGWGIVGGLDGRLGMVDRLGSWLNRGLVGLGGGWVDGLETVDRLPLLSFPLIFPLSTLLYSVFSIFVFLSSCSYSFISCYILCLFSIIPYFSFTLVSHPSFPISSLRSFILLLSRTPSFSI